MRAGLAALDVLEEDDLGARATRLGTTLRERLRTRLAGYTFFNHGARLNEEQRQVVVEWAAKAAGLR